jgi:hypothetical protein
VWAIAHVAKFDENIYRTAPSEGVDASAKVTFGWRIKQAAAHRINPMVDPSTHTPSAWVGHRGSHGEDFCAKLNLSSPRRAWTLWRYRRPEPYADSVPTVP